jgi:hypothetical protein
MLGVNNMNKKIVLMGLLAVFMLVSTSFVSSAGVSADANLVNDDTTGIESNYEKEPDVFTHPEYYDITVWKIQPTSYEEEVIRVSYDDAMEIKASYEQIESSIENPLDRVKQKNAVLRNYGVLSSDDTLENYEKEFNKWTETQNMNKLWKIANLFFQKLKNLDIPIGEQCAAMLGMIAGYFHGPLEGCINMGIPLPMTAFICNYAVGQGPAEGISTMFFILPIFPVCYFLEETTDDVEIVLALGIGYVTYLPFLFNMNAEGRFEFVAGCTFGCMANQFEY